MATSTCRILPIQHGRSQWRASRILSRILVAAIVNTAVPRGMVVFSSFWWLLRSFSLPPVTMISGEDFLCHFFMLCLAPCLRTLLFVCSWWWFHSCPSWRSGASTANGVSRSCSASCCRFLVATIVTQPSLVGWWCFPGGGDSTASLAPGHYDLGRRLP